ncbi:MAG: hypothetical protein ACTJLL_03800 [Anaplasma sp.]
MSVSVDIHRRLLQVEKINYVRHCCSLFTLSVLFAMFLVFALAQAGMLSGLGVAAPNFWIAFECLGALLSLTGFVLTALLVFKVEVEKRKIASRIKREYAQRGMQSALEREMVDRKLPDRLSDFIEGNASKLDLAASTLFAIMALVSIGFLLSSGVNFSAAYKVGSAGMGATHVTDIIANSLHFMASLAFTVSLAIVHRKAPKRTENMAKQERLMLLLLSGSFLLLAGKVVVALESVGIIEGSTLPTGGTFPIGWSIRLVGVALTLVSVCLIVSAASEKCSQFKRVVESGYGAEERLSTLSIHEIRSCFGYSECGALPRR